MLAQHCGQTMLIYVTHIKNELQLHFFYDTHSLEARTDTNKRKDSSRKKNIYIYIYIIIYIGSKLKCRREIEFRTFLKKVS